MNKIRIFVSSPSDVSAERRRVDNVVKRIQADYEDLEFEIIRWEENFYSARSTFQDQIVSSADADIVLCILWKRLGSPLPDEYRRKDGSSRTGTEFEFETAMEAALTAELPDILVYRATREITFSAEHVEQEQAELQMLENFWRRWIQNEKGHFTAGFKPFEQTDEFEQLLEKDLRAWLKRRFHNVSWPASKGSPYRGLAVFEEEHAPIYFGRRRAINEVRARLIANEQRDGVGFLLIIGASGAGKSSLLRAGLIPALKDSHPVDGIAGWRTLTIRPTELGSDPILGLANKLCQQNVLPELLDGDYAQPAELASLWSGNPQAAATPVCAALKRWAKKLTEEEQMNHTADTRLLIAIDQFEEIFQLSDEQQSLFLKIIDKLAHSGKVWLVATMRSDFYPQLFSLPELMHLKDASRQYDLNIPRAHELQEIISGPATAAGLHFEQNEHGEGLDQRLLEDAEGNPAALPLLEFTLEQLYLQHDRDEQQLSFKSYQQLGGLQGALTQAAEDALAEVKQSFNDDADKVFARVMRELVSINEDGKATRRVAMLDSFKNNLDDQRLVDALVKHRLLTGYTANIADNETAQAVVNITHEALIEHWQRMQQWLEQDLELLQVRERTSQDCSRWLNENKRQDLLATSGKRLEDIRFLQNSELQLDTDTTEFITTSLSRAKKLQKRKRIVQTSFSIISILAAIFGAITLNSLDELAEQENKIQQQQQRLTSESIKNTGLIAEAEYAKASLLQQQQNYIAALGNLYKTFQRAKQVENIRLDKPGKKSIEQNWLAKTLQQPQWYSSAFKPANQLTNYISMPALISPDKKTLLVSERREDNDGWYSSLFNIKTQEILGKPVNSVASFSTREVVNASFSPDSQKLAIVIREYELNRAGRRRYKYENTIELIDTSNGKVLNNRLHKINDFKQIKFLNNNQLVILQDNKVILWNTDTSKNLEEAITLFSDNDHYLQTVDVIAGDTLLINNKQIWKKQDNLHWEQIATLDNTYLYGNILNEHPVLITEDGFITLTTRSTSFWPQPILDFIITSTDMDKLIEWAQQRIKLQPMLVRVTIKGNEVTTRYTDITPPDSVSRGNSGYLAITRLLQKDTNKQPLSFVVEFVRASDLLRQTYFYKQDINNTDKTIKPLLLESRKNDPGTIISGYAPIGKQMLFTTFDGNIIRTGNNNSHPETSRVSNSIAGLYKINDKLLFANRNGNYLIPATNLSGQSIPTTSSATLDTLYKYSLAYQRDTSFPETFIDKHSGQLLFKHKKITQALRRLKSKTTFLQMPVKLSAKLLENTSMQEIANDIQQASRSEEMALAFIKRKKTMGFRASLNNKTVLTDTGRRRKITNARNNLVSTALLRPANNVLLTGYWDGSVGIYNTANRQPKYLAAVQHSTHNGIQSLAIAPSGKLFASGDRSGIVNLWSIDTDKKSAIQHIATLKHDSGIVSLSFSADGNWIISATDTDKIYFWDNKGKRLGKPVKPAGLNIANIALNQDNWWLTVISKAGKAYAMEVGDQLIPKRVMQYLSLLAQNELFKQKITDTPVTDTNNLIAYYLNPPSNDKTYWTALINYSLRCSTEDRCKDITTSAISSNRDTSKLRAHRK